MRGPRPLKSLLAAWRPAKSGLAGNRLSFDEAGAALAIAWEQAVGAAVAARSRPMKYRDGVLSILTASSAWSDELNQLSPRIIAALKKLCPYINLIRLRFVVASGRSRALLDSGARRQRTRSVAAKRAVEPKQGTNVQTGAAPPAEDITSLVRRLAALQQTLDAQRDRAGWRVCASCGKRFPAASNAVLCAPCAEEQRRSSEACVERVLMQAPWLRPDDLRSYLPGVESVTVERVRRSLLTRWETELALAQRRLRRGAITAEDRVIAWSYLMLLSGLPQRDLGRAVVVDVLGSDWAGELLVGQEAPSAQREKQR